MQNAGDIKMPLAQHLDETEKTPPAGLIGNDFVDIRMACKQFAIGRIQQQTDARVRVAEPNAAERGCRQQGIAEGGGRNQQDVSYLPGL